MQRLAYGFILPLLVSFNVSAQVSKKMTREEYIKKYEDYAVKEMERTGIPASITLAQGILESGNGNSRLAVKANNHFGIKCHDWNGRNIRHDDDSKNECFRRYRSSYESYRDHSDFLLSKSRYAFLFELDPKDYKQWAIGLKKAGYATSPTYAEALIKIIEENQLYLLDTGVKVPRPNDYLAKGNVPVSKKGTHEIFENNRIKYIIVKDNDSFGSLTAELDLLPWQLPEYNELTDDSQLAAGQVLYIQPKRNKAEAGKKIHIVKKGETMHGISQQYGIKLARLYSRNQMTEGSEPVPGQEISLRGRIKKDKNKADFLLMDEDDKEDGFIIEFDPEN